MWLQTWPSILSGCFEVFVSSCLFFSVSLFLSQSLPVHLHLWLPWFISTLSWALKWTYLTLPAGPVERCYMLMLMWTVRSLLHNVTAGSRVSLKCSELMGHFNRIHALIPYPFRMAITWPLFFFPLCHDALCWAVVSGWAYMSWEDLHCLPVNRIFFTLYIEWKGVKMAFLSVFNFIFRTIY